MSVYIAFPEWFATALLVLLIILIMTSIFLFMVFGVLNVQRIMRREKWNMAPKDMVILHQLARGTKAPSVVPFALKLETYLRMAGIEYENDFEEPFGPKGKCPWITINTQEISDSSFIMEYLQLHFNKDHSKHLTPEEHAAGRALQKTLEEHFYWTIVLHRWVYEPQSYLKKLVTYPYPMELFSFYYRRYFKNQCLSSGMGKHSKEEIIQTTENDLRAFSAYLGKKKFLFGDIPTEYDCACFGILAQVVWNFPGSPYEALAYSDLSNIRDYCHRLKEKYWPDWDRQCAVY